MDMQQQIDEAIAGISRKLVDTGLTLEDVMEIRSDYAKSRSIYLCNASEKFEHAWEQCGNSPLLDVAIWRNIPEVKAYNYVMPYSRALRIMLLDAMESYIRQSTQQNEGQ